MNKDKKIERLEQKLAKVLEENKKLKSDVRKAKRENSQCDIIIRKIIPPDPC